MAVGAVHFSRLLKTGHGVALTAAGATCTPSPRTAGDVKEVHDVALAVGFGADGVCPASPTKPLAKLRHDGLIHAKMRNDIPSPDGVPDDAEIESLPQSPGEGSAEGHVEDGH